MLESVLNQLIDEEALGVCFELHRAIKLGYYELLYPEDRYRYARLVNSIVVLNVPSLCTHSAVTSSLERHGKSVYKNNVSVRSCVRLLYSGCGPAWLGRVRKHCPDVEKAGGLRLPVLQPNVGLAKEINRQPPNTVFLPATLTHRGL